MATRGEHCEVELQSYDDTGLAVGPGPHGVEIRVAGGVAGERVQVVVEHLSPHRPVAWARLHRVLRPSPQRVALPGDHRCGGCGWAHLSYAAQLEAKAAQVHGLARVDEPVLSDEVVRPAPRPRGYRTRSKYVVAQREGRLVLGGYAPRSHHVVSTLTCPVVAPEVARAARVLAEELTRREWPVWDEARQQGLLRHAAVRVNHAGQVLMTVVTADPGGLDWDGLAADLAARVHRLVGFTLDVNPRPGNVIFAARTVPVWGENVLEERYGPVRVRLTGHGFSQVNREQAEALYQFVAKEALRPAWGQPPTRLWDLYSGAGALALTVAHAAGPALRVVGLEQDPHAVEQAREAAQATQGVSCEFVAGDATAAPELLEASGAPDVVVLNPPRRGCPEGLLHGLAVQQIPRLIYVSCSPRTLSRDLSLLSPTHRIHRLQGFDLLPQTPHLELVAVLERRHT